ncbi:hypothetical protein Pan97_22820 [Bremerella volcania]|uniref:Uncharacterized protein n=2 Tax=Bremerella volcania TaxID=2527984 RepID=A0A518C7S8_9BACT|nr:hypothetical protein Pan97_22820 [Bremerella volcania]
MILVGCLGLVSGCGIWGNEASKPPPGIAKAELVATLDKIAETGKYQDVLQQLTIGLEREGLMQEAANLQQFSTLESEERVKRSAKKLSSEVKKKLAKTTQ